MQAGAVGAVAQAPRGVQAATLCEALQIALADHPDRVALRTPGNEFSITWAQYGEQVARTAAGLRALGVSRGDTLGIMLTNRPEFHWIDTAAMHVGATAFSIYNTSSPEQIEYLLADAGNRVMVCEPAFLDRVLAVRGRIASLEHVVVVGGEPGADGIMSLDELDALGDGGFDLEAAAAAASPDDLLTLIYTSGTTGPPKGVQLTHASQMFTIRNAHSLFPVAPGRVVAYLPMAHIAERWWGYYAAICHADTVTCLADPTRLAAALVDTRPTRFLGVPRVWEKLKAALEAGMAAEPDAQRRGAVDAALQAGRARVAAEQAGGPIPDDVEEAYRRADELVLSKIRAKLGLDQLDYAGVGAAPSPRELLEFFAALGVPIVEGWAMSETSAAGTINTLEARRFGTVGRPGPGVEVMLDRDGELLIRGPMLMTGYRNKPEMTAETIDSDGWLHTGDVATIDEDGYVKIVDRKKELIINAAGKNMSPANIESALKSSGPLIGQACVIGDSRPYNVALLVLDPDAAAGLDPADPDVVARVQTEVEAANAKLSRVEQIKRFKLLEQEWLPGGDELTPTMKLKRKPIAAKYEGEIEALYA
jgi:long-subunit acyl-CoA synthetase (AMP-forming)